MSASTFTRFAGAAAIVAGIGGLLYSLDFTAVALKWRASAPELGAFLLIGGLLSAAVFVALYEGLRETDAGFATLALVLGVVAALGSALHGGYDLANALHPEVFKGAVPGADIPSPVDPRGLATFGLAGLAILVFSWLIVRGGKLPKGLGYLGYALGALLVVIYLGRLIVLRPAPLLVPAALTGLVINPAWYIWLGLTLWRTQERGAR
jgi:hypothetical protein